MSENIRTAVITALAATLGGLIAGGASIATTLVNQNSENERVEKRLDNEARGAARAMISWFTVSLNYSGRILVNGEFLPFPPDFLTPLTRDDLKLVASRLAPEAFLDLDYALRDTKGVIASAEEQLGRKLPPGEGREILGIRQEMKIGRNALTDIADMPPFPDPRGQADAKHEREVNEDIIRERARAREAREKKREEMARQGAASEGGP
jgi:hypothetical protein